MRLLVLLALVVTTIVLSPGTAHACVCQGEDRDTSAAVFIGTATASRQSHVTQPIVYTFTADRVLEGPAGPVFEVWTGPAGNFCGSVFKLGARYLIFAERSRDAKLGTGVCSGNVELTPGSDDAVRAALGLPHPVLGLLTGAAGTLFLH